MMGLEIKTQIFNQLRTIFLTEPQEKVKSNNEYWEVGLTVQMVNFQLDLLLLQKGHPAI